MDYKLIEYDKKYFVITPCMIEENSWDILGVGDSIDEAYQSAFENVLSCYERHLKAKRELYVILGDRYHEGIDQDKWYPTRKTFSLGKHQCEEIGEDTSSKFYYCVEKEEFIPTSDYFYVSNGN